MTEQTQPTDAEIDALAREHKTGPLFFGNPTFDVHSFARAVLAKWGTPAGAGEQTMADVIAACNGTEAYGLIIGLRTQVALLEAMMDAQKCDGAGQQSIQTQPTLGEPVGEVQHLHEWNDEWLSKLPIGTKLYTTPQPTQAQAGAVPQHQPTPDVQAKMAVNQWDSFGEILPTLKAISRGEWYWGANSRCKYIEIRLDTRDGGCLLFDRERVRISPAQFAHQSHSVRMEPWPGIKGAAHG